MNQNAAPALGPGQNAGACGAGVRQKAEGSEQIEGSLDTRPTAQAARRGHTRTAPRTENCCISTSGIGQYKGVEHPPGAQAVK